MQEWQEDNILGHIESLKNSAEKQWRYPWAMADGMHSIFYVLHTLGHISSFELTILARMVNAWAVSLCKK